MHECLSIHVGGAGVRLGGAVWKLFCKEHGLAPITCYWFRRRQSNSISSFFNQSMSGRFTPRAIMVDTEPSAINEVWTDDYRDLFYSDQFISGKEDAANCYARGYNLSSDHPAHPSAVMKRINKMAENCDNLQGFLLFHSLGGGTGSGLTSAILESLASEYPSKTKINYAIYPSLRYCQMPVQPYNCAFAINASMPHVECTFLLDNDAIYNMTKGVGDPKLNDLNNLIAQVVSGTTLGLRFSAPLLSTMQDFAINLVPQPRLHFPLVSYAPITGMRNANNLNSSASALTHSCFDPENTLLRCDARRGKYAACCLLYRGSVTAADVNRAITSIKNNRNIQFVSWCPAGFKISIHPKKTYTIPGDDFYGNPKSSLCMLSTNSAISELWGSLKCTFENMFSKKAFLHWYLEAGLSEHRFHEARWNVEELEKEYKDLFASTTAGSFR